MTAAVILLWASCLWSIARSLLSFLLSASLQTRLLALALAALTLSSCHQPRERNPNKPLQRGNDL